MPVTPAEFEFVSYCDFKGTFRFFRDYINEELESPEVRKEMRFARIEPSEEEKKHASSVLAHFAQTSTISSPGAHDLTYVYDNYVADSKYVNHAEIMEIAAAQTLFLNGFFRQQMRDRHDVHWYDGLGRFFYNRAGRLSSGPKHRSVMLEMAEDFSFWARRFRDLNVRLSKNTYIIWH